MRKTGLAIAVVVVATAAIAQTPRPAFEVATIRRNVAVDAGFAAGFQPGGRFRAVGMDVRTLIAIAYRMGARILPSQIVGGPDWVSTDGYDIDAKASGEIGGQPAQRFATQQLLLQSLLEDRFKLKVHRETRQEQIYALVLSGKSGALGPQLRRSTVDCAANASACETRALPGQFVSTNSTMAGLAVFLASNVVRRVVVDRTGLTGMFAVDLEWTPDRAPLPLGSDAPPPSDKPSIFAALQEQLGLKLEAVRGPVEVVVIDHIERPTEN